MFGGNEKDGHYRSKCSECGENAGEPFCKNSDVIQCKKCSNCWTRNNIGSSEPIQEKINDD
jgi:hypothetical protein